MKIVRNKTAPKAEICHGGSFRGSAFVVETWPVSRRRVSIQRHFENSSGASGRSRARSRLESFPMSAARLIEVDVGIDHSGEDGKLRCINFFTAYAGQVFPNCH